MDKRKEEQRGNSPESESNSGANRPQTGQQNQTPPQEGDYRNAEAGVNSTEGSGDDFQTQQEDDPTMEEQGTEKDGATGKS